MPFSTFLITFNEFVEPNYIKEENGVRIEDADLKEGDCIDRGMLGLRVKFGKEMIPVNDYRAIKIAQFATKTL